MATVMQKIKDIKDEITRTQKNKANAHQLGLLKAKLAKLQRELLASTSIGGDGASEGFDVTKSGDARVGFPSFGESILNKLTGTFSEENLYTSKEIEIEIDEVKVKLQHKMYEASYMVKNLKDLKVLLQEQVELRREAHNKLLDEQGNVRVLCRCRPLIPQAVGSEALTCDKEDKDTLIYSGEPFQFDHVFGENVGQDEVFEKICPYITHVLDGRNLCLLAYGQTGSGKTYTMQGTKGDGLYHKTCSKLFEDMQTKETSYEVTASVMEICDKKVFDLITKERTSIQIRKDGHGKNHLTGLTEKRVHNCKEVLHVIKKGTKKRRTESTVANATSSRSHCLVLLKVTQANKLSKTTITSNLWLIDLAGSEKSPEDKKQRKDSADINQSLLYLAYVMSAKANDEYTTYRNSVFTRILEDSLGDEGSKIVMIVHISRAECDIVESVKTLRFGVMAGNVQISYASPKLRCNIPSKMLSVASRSRCTKDGAQSSRHDNKATVATWNKENREGLGRSLIKRRNKTEATPAEGCGAAPLESVRLAKAASISSSHLINDMCTKDCVQGFGHNNDKATVSEGEKEDGEGLGRPLIQRWNKTVATPAEMRGAAPVESVRLAEVASISSPNLINGMDVTLDAMEERQRLWKEQEDLHASSLRVPRRPPRSTHTSVEELDENERQVFQAWLNNLSRLQENDKHILTPFESNIDIWMQLWKVVECSDLLVMIVDARDPLFFRCPDLEMSAKEIDAHKKTMLLVNKADLLPLNIRKKWAAYFKAHDILFAFWSATEILEGKRLSGYSEEESSLLDLDTKIYDRDQLLTRLQAEAESVMAQRRASEEDSDASFSDSVSSMAKHLVVGFVGYPSVGKRSTINALVGENRNVPHSPGQMLLISEKLMLYDCPGMVFPSFSSSEHKMVARGVLPMKMTKHREAIQVVVDGVPQNVLEQIYNITLIASKPSQALTAAELLRAYCASHGSHSGLSDETRAARQIVKDYIDGKIPHFELPPRESESLTSKVAHEAVLNDSTIEETDPLVEPNMRNAESNSVVQYSDSGLERILIRWVRTDEPHEDIEEFDIYSCTPQKWKKAYYLVKLKKVKNGKYNRKFVGGTWKRSHRKASDELQAASKYIFTTGTREQENGYIMFEYTLVDGPKDRVLCHIINEAFAPKQAQKSPSAQHIRSNLLETVQELKDIQKVHLGENNMRSCKEKISCLTSELLQLEEGCTKHKEEKQRLESRIAEEKQATQKYTQQLLHFRAFKANNLSTRKQRKINNLSKAEKKCKKKQDERHVLFEL